MTTSLAFIKAGLEKKIEIDDVDNNITFEELSDTIKSKLTELNAAPNPDLTICFIYSGKILNPKDTVGSIRNPDIEPPYTLQILIRQKSTSSPDNQIDEDEEKKGSCCLLL